MRGHHPDRRMSRSAAVGSVGCDAQRVDSSRERRVLRARVIAELKLKLLGAEAIVAHGQGDRIKTYARLSAGATAEPSPGGSVSTQIGRRD